MIDLLSEKIIHKFLFFLVDFVNKVALIFIVGTKGLCNLKLVSSMLVHSMTH